MDHEQNAGRAAFYVTDCRVWAEINYLDSPTDYREYLATAPPGRNAGTNDERVGPDKARRPPQGIFHFVLFLACMLVFWLLLHVFGHY